MRHTGSGRYVFETNSEGKQTTRLFSQAAYLIADPPLSLTRGNVT